MISVPEFLSIFNLIDHMIFKGFPIFHLCINGYFTLQLLRYNLENRISVCFWYSHIHQTQNGNTEVPACGGGGGGRGYCV